eukprot:817612-Rhodomonas_salina.1
MARHCPRGVILGVVCGVCRGSCRGAFLVRALLTQFLPCSELQRLHVRKGHPGAQGTPPRRVHLGNRRHDRPGATSAAQD